MDEQVKTETSANPWVVALRFLIAMTLVFGLGYTAVCTGLAQMLFPHQANGSIIEGEDGKRYSVMIGQDFSADTHMWGRVTNVDTATFADDEGNPLAWYAPSNLSPAGEEFEAVVAGRVAMIRAAHPEKGEEPIPSDLVTCSGSGFDPHVSPAAADFQVERLARTTGKTVEEIEAIIAACTEEAYLGVFGDPRVNVVMVNLMLDGIIPLAQGDE